MRLLLFLRALLSFNFYNWNKQTGFPNIAYVVVDKDRLVEINVAQLYRVLSVNRTTGLVEMEWY